METKYALIATHGRDSYLASSDGHVFRVRKLSPSVNRSGYAVVNMFDNNGENHPRTVHRIIAEAFIGPRPPGYTINHKDGNKINCRVENLEYATQSENVQHAIRTGLRHTSPEAIKRMRQANLGHTRRRKLTEEDVIEIIRLHRTGNFAMRELGEQYSVSAAAICLAIEGKKTYRNVPRPDPLPKKMPQRAEPQSVTKKQT